MNKEHLNILVSGGAGFIGSHLVDALLIKGHTVTVLDDLSTGFPVNLSKKARFLKLDIRSRNLATLFMEEQFDVVYHFAAQMNVRKSVEDPQFDASVNIIGGLNLLENCKKYKIKKFIFASTGGAIYGDQSDESGPAKENHPTNPVSPYGVAKLAYEHYLYYYHEVYRIPYISLRFANVYGPRQNPHGEAGVVAIFTSKMLKGETPIINGDGLQTRDYVYVADIVDANISCLNYEGRGIFNLGTGLESDVVTLYNELKDKIGISINPIHGPAKPGEQRRSVLDYSLAKEKLGWEPKVTLSEGLSKTVEYFRNKI